MNMFARSFRLVCKISAPLAAAIGLATAVRLPAQTAVSNLGQGGTSTANIGHQFFETYRRAYSFTTGSTAASFSFSSFTMAFNNATGSPSTLSVGLYSSFNAGTVAGGSGLLANLSLSSGNPMSAGNAVFSGSATLSSSTTYYLLLSSGTSDAAGNYYTYNVVNSGNEDSGGLSGWTIGDSAFESDGNNTWTSLTGPSHFSIQASAIPEPSTYAAMAGVAMLGLAVWHRRRRGTSAGVAANPAV